MKPSTPAELAAIRDRVWQAALSIQGGNPSRPVSVPEIARVTGLRSSRINAAIRWFRQRSLSDPGTPGWTFPVLRDAPSVRARSRSARSDSGSSPGTMGRAYGVQWGDRVWLISAKSSNLARGNAMRRLWAAYPDETIHYRDVVVLRWSVYDPWAMAEETGRLWTSDAVEDWMEAHVATQAGELGHGD